MRSLHILWLLVLTLFVGAFFTYDHINDLIEKKLSKKFKVPVQVETFDYSYAFADIPFFELKDVQISNPKGSILPNAFSCNSVVFKTPYARYLDKQVVIQNLILINPYFSFEFASPDSVQGNWTKLMQNLKETIVQTIPKNRSVLIEKLVLHNINADLVYYSDENKVQTLPFIREIVLTDIRGSGSTLLNELLIIICKEATSAVLKAHNVKNQIEDIPSKVKTQRQPPS
jgi:uncharacterized protein involved in outer membrane biogenesis